MYLQYCEKLCVLLFAVYMDFVPISECVRAVDRGAVDRAQVVYLDRWLA